ncbi:MAG: hypothetical protein SNH28_00710 [Rikenellaceae bacterium]
MRRLIALIALVVVSTTLVEANSRKDKAAADRATATWNYEIEPIERVAKQGSVVVKVSSVAATPSMAASQAYKNAIHGVIFKGIPAVGRIPMRRPMMDAVAAQKHKAFFDEFFRDGGAYMAYATSAKVENSILRISKKEFKVGVYVVINYDELRRSLEKAGVIRGLMQGF